MYRYILFDLDGTLTDPKEGITKCVQYALQYFGIEIHLKWLQVLFLYSDFLHYLLYLVFLNQNVRLLIEMNNHKGKRRKYPRV